MKKLSKTGSKINSSIGRAIHDYDLIEEGDRILVAVSGGKDSLTLLTLLKKIQTWAPVKFEILAAHITTDFKASNRARKKTLTDFFERTGVEGYFDHVDVLNEEGKTNCFWCSWNKRKALFKLAEKLSCNKVALGHHKDDIAETMLMNLFFKGEISVMNPRQELFEGKITVIRPLALVAEETIRAFAKESRFPSKLCKCPFGRNSKRKEIKDLLAKVQKSSPGTNIKTNIFKSIGRIKAGYININE
jgi:tRNA 2-thiocytidine biosynthesis protein TtcA